MLQSIKSYLHRVAERQKAYRSGRRGTVFTIFHNANAVRLSWQSIENDRGEIVVGWPDVIRVAAFKRDLYAVDLICLTIFLKDKSSVEINEEMTGWQSLVEKLPEYLPGCQQFEKWFLVVAFPAFSPNLTVIYERD